MKIEKCNSFDFNDIYEIINDAALAYEGIIPDDCYQRPYMSKKKLLREIDEGIVFWGYIVKEQLVGVMGIQNLKEVTLIRHAYIKTHFRKKGIGRQLLSFLKKRAAHPILIGTWKDAVWAIKFYENNGFNLVNTSQKDILLKKYWNITKKQIETSVVLKEF